MKKKIILIFLAFVFSMFFIKIDAKAQENLEAKVGQMLIVGFHGQNTKSKQYKTIIKQLKKGQIGGVIIYEFNVKSPNDLMDLTRQIKQASNISPFIAIDQEGGVIQILNKQRGFKDYLSQKETAQKLDNSEAYKMYDDLASTLKAYNINYNYAPCVDVILNDKSIINYKKRSFSNDYNIVTNYAKIVLDAHYNNSIITSLKHFPGLGSSYGDTHLGFIDASRDWDEKELEPYIALKDINNLQTIMSSHIYVKSLDEKYPASLSNNIIQKILREQIGFNGVITTDDLHMGAIKNNYKFDEIVIRAINAGNDILLFSNYDKPDMKIPLKVQKIVSKAIKQGQIKQERIDEAYNRIINLKNNLNKKEDLVLLKEELIEKYQSKTPTYWGERAKGVKRRINTDEKIIALTFDACGSKNDGFDKELIDFLIKENVPATLFINKRWIDKNKETFMNLANNPLFDIQNHGLNHVPASINGKSIYGIKGTQNVSQLVDEVEINAQNIYDLTGKKPIYFRSGTAFYDEWASEIISSLGYKPLGFSILGDRGATYNKYQVEKALLSAKNGDIAIFHMNHPEKQTAQGVIRAIPKLKKRGFRFVLVKDYNDKLID